MKQTFELDSEFIELYKLLKLLGVTDSGGMAKAMIADGEVRVDGAVELRKRCKLHKGQVVVCGGVEIAIL
jgi:ribosome-associated protein